MTARVCRVVGCEKPHKARGMCQSHYLGWRRENGILADRPCATCKTGRRANGRPYCKACDQARAAAWRRHKYRTDDVWAAKEHVRVMESNFKLKVEVLAGYGGACVCCGETELVFLTIDHLDGGGRADRAQSAGGWRGVYARLKREGFPAGYAVKCQNCNWASFSLGRCPHQTAQEVAA